VFIVLYTAVFGTGIRYLLKLAAKGPGPLDGHFPEPAPEDGRPARPLSAVGDRLEPAIALGNNRS
jgi:cytochrome bd ubiquinol oxidase subunit I